ncbi:MAG: hypothetical protein M1369_06035 [Deinococcus sp.]|nr:hypothetical protein [Deinococcus sp.]
MGFKLIFRFACLLLLLAMGGSAFAQNTKGDRPVRPLPKVVQKSKPKKSKKIKSDTRDISGRRLRTKNSSSAARAIQRPPSTYFGRKRKGDRASKPIGNNRIQSSTARAKGVRTLMAWPLLFHSLPLTLPPPFTGFRALINPVNSSPWSRIGVRALRNRMLPV